MANKSFSKRIKYSKKKNSARRGNRGEPWEARRDAYAEEQRKERKSRKYGGRNAEFE